jgi:hypothetical protein
MLYWNMNKDCCASNLFVFLDREIASEGDMPVSNGLPFLVFLHLRGGELLRFRVPISISWNVSGCCLGFYFAYWRFVRTP